MAMRSIIATASTLTEPGTETPFQLRLKSLHFIQNSDLLVLSLIMDPLLPQRVMKKYTGSSF